jgi:Holliday junction resolvasome RuvABC endonuclease subunit
MLIIGLDIGITNVSPCGFAVYEPHADQVLSTALIKPRNTGDDVDERIADIGGQIMLKIKSWKDVVCIAYEAPHVRENPQTALKLARMCGAVVMIAHVLDIPCIGVQPVSAKVALTSNPTASKEAMIISAERQFAEHGLTSHEADAIGVALAGWAQYRLEKMEGEAETEALA